MQSDINDIITSSGSESIGNVIISLRAFIQTNRIAGVLSKLDKLDEDYKLTQHFMLMGYDDPQREGLLSNLRFHLYKLACETKYRMIVSSNHSVKPLYDDIKSKTIELAEAENRLLQFDQEIAMSALTGTEEAEVKRLYSEQLDYRRMLFNYIVTSPMLSDQEAEQLTQLLLSPVVDTIDRQLITNALFLAIHLNWDALKFVVLCNVYEQTDDMRVKELSLIAIALSLPEEIHYEMTGDQFEVRFQEVFNNPESLQRLADLQNQLLLTADTERTDKMVEQEIMPKLKSHVERLSKELTDDDDIRKILHPNADEEGIDDIEKVLSRMRKLKQSGADVFYGGFSKTKRFAFFYTLMNWFCPFYMEHPQLGSIKGSENALKLTNLVSHQQMCNSDKYSFVLSLASIMNNMPKELSKMIMPDGDLPDVDSIIKDDTEIEIRQLCLQDLYRFFKLFPYKNDFEDVFDDSKRICFFNHSLMCQFNHESKSLVSIAHQLIRRDRLEEAYDFLSVYSEEDVFEYDLLNAVLSLKAEDYENAFLGFLRCLLQQPDNTSLIEKAALAAYASGKYPEAKDLYERLVTLNPDDEELEFALAQCLYQMGLEDEAMKHLFHLYFEHSDNNIYKMYIARGYVIKDKIEEALKMYGDIPEGDMPDLIVCYKGIALWLSRRINEAVAVFQSLYKKLDKDSSVFTSCFTKSLQNIEKISEEEQLLMLDIIMKE